MSQSKNNLIIFTGPSGVGKGTIVKELFKNLDNIEFSISCTTRAKRPQEIEAVNYFFKSKEEFEAMIQNDEFLEYAEFVGNYYGTPKAFVESKLKEGKDVFLEIEVQGALNVIKKFPDVLSVFLMPPRFEDLESRLRNRATESEAVLQKRLAKAKEELKYLNLFKHIIINDDISQATQKIQDLIIKARTPNLQQKL